MDQEQLVLGLLGHGGRGSVSPALCKPPFLIIYFSLCDLQDKREGKRETNERGRKIFWSL